MCIEFISFILNNNKENIKKIQNKYNLNIKDIMIIYKMFLKNNKKINIKKIINLMKMKKN